MRSRRRRALLPLRATPHVAWPPFFRPAHAAGCAAGEAARRAMDQGAKGPRGQGAKGPRGRVHVGRRQSRKPCLPSSRGGSVTTAFRHGSWLDASTINVRRLPRNHGRRRVLHLSASIRCFTFAAAPRPNPKRPVRRPAARAIRRVRRSPFAARCSLLARRSIMRAAAADPDAHTRPTDLHVRSDRRIVLREIRALSRVLGRARARAASARARRTARRWIGARATGGSSRFRSARRARRPLPGSSALRRQSAASPRAVFQAAIRRRE
ncbi:Uncharacterised protein [Burkholderia pseudomallei]|nr:Uncharacterised protein [Burkholderia pseudomallei]VBZ61624.1 Uncharacterised protein [Burkholderia pseudomallei]VBZ61810.1 Uncharacterised protein [Burkholderia pseudomallei]VBZ71685.1 Uncharacterised protein [Burkholderia pseudomallei]VBZ77306.1 Uncharacterised protein [Burkholderia pseudomallei]